MNIVTDINSLRMPSLEVSPEEGKSIGEALVEELKSRRDMAVGLAAPQVGINACVFAMRDNQGYKYFVNPKIISQESPFLFKDEGCLSFPGKRINTIRFEKVTFSDSFNPHIEMKNFAAVVAKHEIDHLNGVLMMDVEADVYAPCPCGSGKKFKFCHMR